MFDWDISYCGNSDKCPLKDECRRGKVPGPGIYSYCLFYEEGKECKDFYPKKEEVDNYAR